MRPATLAMITATAANQAVSKRIVLGCCLLNRLVDAAFLEAVELAAGLAVEVFAIDDIWARTHLGQWSVADLYYDR